MKYIKTYEKLNESDRFIKAARIGNLDEVKALLNQGIDVNIKNKFGTTALIYASYNGHLDIVKELLKRSDIDVNIKNKFGTALIYASINGHLDIVKELLKRSDIDLNIKDNDDDKDFFDYLKEDQKEVIIKEFPEQYQRYLIRKKASKYNI